MELKDPHNVALDSLISSGIEAAWRLSDWGELDNFSKHESKDTFESSLGRIFNLLKKKDYPQFESCLRNLSERDHSLSSLETYQRDYDFFVQLHIQRDLGSFWKVFKENEGNHNITSLFNSWEKRIDITKPNIRTRELILNVHIALINIVLYFLILM
jgi:hypothetical protein